MLEARTLKFLAAFAVTLGVFLLPALFWPGYLDSPIGMAVAVPYLSIYLFHGLGIPGLLEHGGACGWGWCAPTLFGWVFLCLVWGLLAWCAAWATARMSLRGDDKPGSAP